MPKSIEEKSFLNTFKVFKGEFRLINYQHVPKIIKAYYKQVGLLVRRHVFKVNILKAINSRREQKTTEMYTLFVSITVSIKINIVIENEHFQHSVCCPLVVTLCKCICTRGRNKVGIAILSDKYTL